MTSIAKPLARLTALAALAILPTTAAFAQANVEPRIAVPAPGPGPGAPQPANFQGCYSINQNLYGPYRMSFCLNQYGNGSYQVTGGGLNCNGRLDWNEWNGEARVNVQYTWCGNGVGWSADTMVCRTMQGGGGPWQQPQGQWNQPNARIAIPVPVSNDLRCSYYPGVRGFDPVSVIAERGWW